MKKFLLVLILSWVCTGTTLLSCLCAQPKNPPGRAPADKEYPQAQKAAHRPKTARALLEAAALITGSTIDYWRTYHDFQEDWQFRLTWKDQKRRFFTAESPKMDSNSFWFNWSHALSGAYYYSAARTNGLSNRASFLFSLGMSAFWECVSEWREIISINDIIFTSFGGPAVGESMFQMSSFFSHRKGFFNQLGCFIFSPFLLANNWFDRNSGRAVNSGPEALWHDFRLYAAPKNGTISPSGTSYRHFNLGLEMETNTVPGYGEAQTFRRFVPDTIFSRFSLNFSYSSAGQEEFDIRTQAVLFGYTWQALRKGEDGAVRGVSGSLGAGCGFDTFKKRPEAWYDSSSEIEGEGPALSDARFWRPSPTQFTDKLSTLSLLGPVLQISWFRPHLHVRWMTETYFDFALVNALAYNRFTEKHDNSGVKTTLLNWGYYYAWGTTLSTGLAADWRQCRLRGNVRYQWYDSIQGQDRYQFLGLVTDDFKIRDSRLVWRFSLGYRLPRTPLELALAAEGIIRRGGILEIRERYRENRVYYQVGLIF
jgi:hypothetical protein